MKSESNTYRYIAKNKDSYRKLVRELVKNEDLQLTLYPGVRTIVACPFCTSPNLDEACIGTVGQYIDDNGLDFIIEPVECDIEDALGDTKALDPSTLINLIFGLNAHKEELEGVISNLKDVVNRLKDQRENSRQNLDTMRERLNAVKTMMETIYLY